MKEIIEKLESKVKNCHNTNTILDTRNYVLLDDVRKIISDINNRHTSELNCGWYGEIEKLCNCKEPDDSGWYGDARKCKCGGLYIE